VYLRARPTPHLSARCARPSLLGAALWQRCAPETLTAVDAQRNGGAPCDSPPVQTWRCSSPPSHQPLQGPARTHARTHARRCHSRGSCGWLIRLVARVCAMRAHDRPQRAGYWPVSSAHLICASVPLTPTLVCIRLLRTSTFLSISFPLTRLSLSLPLSISLFPSRLVSGSAHLPQRPVAKKTMRRRVSKRNKFCSRRLKWPRTATPTTSPPAAALPSLPERRTAHTQTPAHTIRRSHTQSRTPQAATQTAGSSEPRRLTNATWTSQTCAATP